jgi:hypothetical protein
MRNGYNMEEQAANERKIPVLSGIILSSQIICKLNIVNTHV